MRIIMKIKGYWKRSTGIMVCFQTFGCYRDKFAFTPGCTRRLRKTCRSARPQHVFLPGKHPHDLRTDIFVFHQRQGRDEIFGSHAAVETVGAADFSVGSAVKEVAQHITLHLFHAFGCSP